MMDTFFFKKVFELGAGETIAIIRHQQFRQSMVTETGMQASMVVAELAQFTGYTSIHFECESTSTKNIFSINGPA